MAGLAVHEAAIRPLAAEINNTINDFVGKRLGKRLELHGNPMRTGGGSWDQDARVIAGRAAVATVDQVREALWHVEPVRNATQHGRARLETRRGGEQRLEEGHNGVE